MSPIALHGLAATDCPVLDAGLPPHWLIGLGEFSALVSEAQSDLDLAEEAERAALTHHRLVTGYHARSPILPVRFGSQFSSVETLRAHLAPQMDRLSQALAALAGMDEMTLSLAAAPKIAAQGPEPDSGPEVRTGGGADWLRARQAQRDRQKTHAQVRAKAMGALRTALERRVARLVAIDPDQGLARWQVLLPRHDRAALDAWLATQDSAFDAAGIEVTLEGPWPPYSFAAALMGAENG